MHIIMSKLQFKLDVFLWRIVYTVKLKGSFGGGVAAVIVDLKMETQNPNSRLVLTSHYRHFGHRLEYLPLLHQPVGSLRLGTWRTNEGSNGPLLLTLRLSELLGSALNLLIEASLTRIPVRMEVAGIENRYLEHMLPVLRRKTFTKVHRVLTKSDTLLRKMENENRRRRLEKLAEGKREKLIAGIKNQYLGLGSAGKRRRTKKSRSNFEWDYYSDDTSFGDSIYLYQNPHCPFFGQRFRAGIDQKNDGGAVETSDDDTSWTDFMRDLNISCRGSGVTKPMRDWAETGLSRQLLYAVVHRAGYSSPTPIQMAVIPLGLRRRDYVCLSNTGSGKTTTFVLPMLFCISRLPLLRHGKNCADQGPYGLVLAPSFECVQHIENEVLKFAPLLGINVISLAGGPGLSFNASQGCEVLITTPGNLLYCLEEGDIVLHQCDYVVLDKADHMIGIGYEEELVSILDAMGLGDFTSKNEVEVGEINNDEDIYPTTCIFSATMEPAVERLAMKYLRNPVVVTVGNPGKATDLITQNVIMMEESEKLCRLPKLLEEHGDKKTIVFVSTPISAILVYEIIMKAGCKAEIFYGSSQEFTIRHFIVLVATDADVLGLDTYDVAHVINYDMPGHIVTYMRRLERTGRWGKTGLATTFLTLNDTEVFYDLKQTLIQSNSYVPPELDRHKASHYQPVKKPPSRYVD